MTNDEIQAVVTATVAALEKRNSSVVSEMPITNQQNFGKITVPANGEKEIPFLGSYVAIFSNTASSDVMVSLDNGIANYIKAGTGYPCVRISKDRTTYEPATFKRVRFQNYSDEDMTIEYVLSLGPVTDTRAVVEGAMQVYTSSPIIDSPAALSVPTDEVLVLASNALVTERMITNTGTSVVWFGSEAVDPDNNRGTPLYPGGSTTLNCWGAIYFKAAGSQGTISLNEVKRSV